MENILEKNNYPGNTWVNVMNNNTKNKNDDIKIIIDSLSSIKTIYKLNN